LMGIKDPNLGEKVASQIFGISSDRKGQAIAIYVPSLIKDRAEERTKISKD